MTPREELGGVHALLDALGIPRTTANPSGGAVTLTAAGRVSYLANRNPYLEPDTSGRPVFGQRPAQVSE